MKKGLLSVLVLISCCLIWVGCIKNTPYVTTIDPSLTATIGTYNFVAKSVVPISLDTQVNDTSKTLIIQAVTTDRLNPYDKIVLAVADYTGQTGTFSIVQGQAGAEYFHGPTRSIALGGIVSITRVTSNSIVGYFSFTTNDGLTVSNGNFNVGKP